MQSVDVEVTYDFWTTIVEVESQKLNTFMASLSKPVHSEPLETIQDNSVIKHRDTWNTPEWFI